MTGYSFKVEIRVWVKRWFPEMRRQPHSNIDKSLQTETNTDEIPYRKEIDLIAMGPELTEVDKRIRECLTEDEGRIGVHHGVGIVWRYEVLSVERKGDVRLAELPYEKT